MHLLVCFCGCFIFSWQHNYIVSSLQQQGFCFGFVEFEVPSAVQKALEVCSLLTLRFVSL